MSALRNPAFEGLYQGIRMFNPIQTQVGGGGGVGGVERGGVSCVCE